MEAKLLDKVRLKSGSSRGARADITAIDSETIIVRLDGTSIDLKVSEIDLTNFSLAARRAWKSMPDRRVGRPQGTTTSNRVSVTLRINAQLWARFRAAEQAGLITDRNVLLESCLTETLDRIESSRSS